MCATTQFFQQKPCILNLDPYNEVKRGGQGVNEMVGENYSNKFRSELGFLSIPHHDNFCFPQYLQTGFVAAEKLIF